MIKIKDFKKAKRPTTIFKLITKLRKPKRGAGEKLEKIKGRLSNKIFRALVLCQMSTLQ